MTTGEPWDPTARQAGGGQASVAEMLSAIGALRPRPSPYPLVRVGGERDGAYLVPEDLDGVAACFSPGAALRKAFEDELANGYGIRSHICDRSTEVAAFQTPLLSGMQTFDQLWLDVDGARDSITLAEWVARHEPGNEDLVLQMDIEGAEYRNITATPTDVLARFRIIVMELHGLGRLRNGRFLQQVFMPFLDRLRGFSSIHLHPNNCCGDWEVPGTTVRVPFVLEWTLIRNDRMRMDPTAPMYAPRSPHPLDIRNVPDRAPLRLDDWWVASALPSDRSAHELLSTRTDDAEVPSRGAHRSMVRDVSRSARLPSSPRSPVAGRRSPLADVLEGDAVLQALLSDLDVQLVFAWLDLPRKAAGQRADEILDDLDEATLERIQHDRAYLVIDHSSEGPRHTPEFSRLLHDWCSLRNVSPSRMIYVTANLGYDSAYQGWCEESGVREQYAHVVFNAYVHEVAAVVAKLDVTELETRLLGRGARPYRFLSFNNAPRPTRLIVAAHMLAAEPPDALVSVGGAKGQVTSDRALAFINEHLRQGPLLERHARVFDDLDIDRLRARATLPPPDSEKAVSLYRTFDLERYTSSDMSVVAETEMSGGLVRRLTEKAVKPFLFGHVAIVAGNPGSLAQIRGLGFQTFAPLVDERYDEISDPRERLCAVLCEIDRLRALDERVWLEVLEASHEVRRANLQHGHAALRRQIEQTVVSAIANRIASGTSAGRPPE